jgi:hypothetical protein
MGSFCSVVCTRSVWHRSCLNSNATLRSRCEAVMWKITARGFTLQEVLILAAMNVATAVIVAEKRGPGASQNSTKRSIHAI